MTKANIELRSETDMLFTTVAHPVLKISVNIYIVGRGGSKGHFYGRYKDKYFNGKLYSEIHQEIMSYLESLEGTLDWHPVLVLEVRREKDKHHWDGNKAELSITAQRFYVALNQRKKWLRVDWDTPEKDRREKCDQVTPNGRNDSRRGYSQYAEVDFGALPQTIGDKWNGNQLIYLLPYSEQMFNAISWLGGEIVKLGDVLDKMLGSDEGKAAIVDRSMKLISMPVDKP